MIHALHIFTDMRMGDRAKNFLDFLSSYDRKEALVTVILPQESPIIRAVEKTGHPPILLRNIADAPHSFLGRRALRREVKRLSPHIIHVYGGWVCDALKKSGIPLVDDPADLETARWDNGYRRILAPSPWAKEMYRLRGIPEETITLLPPGISPAPFYSAEEKEKIRRSLGFEPEDIVVSVFHPLGKSKGYPLFFAAAGIARLECPKLKFLVVGNGSMKHQYMRKAVSLGLKKSVKFVHTPTDCDSLLNITDILLDISEDRPISRTVLSGMSLGKPLIAFPGGGNSFMVENGVTGLLLSSLLSKKIAGAILELVKNPAIAASMGASGKKRMMSLFSAEKAAENTLSLYRELLGEMSHEKTISTPSQHECD